MDVKEVKQMIRASVWERLEAEGAARFPKPIAGRIPNFLGAEAAAKRIVELESFKRARVVKVNPDSPQRPIREAVIRSGRTLVVPTPRLKDGFLLIRPGSVPDRYARKASSIGGAAQLGEQVELSAIPKIELLVVGSVAVSPDGARLGKGHGYGEIEYGILRQLGCVDECTPIASTVHELQIVRGIPVEEHDVPVDVIATPTRSIETHTEFRRPRGIIWERVTPQMMDEMPVLKSIKEGRGR